MNLGRFRVAFSILRMYSTISIMILPSFRHFLFEVLIRAGIETKHLVFTTRALNILIGLGLNGVAILIYYLWKGWPSVSDKVHFFLVLVVINIAVVIAIFCVNLGRAPYLLYRDQNAKIADQERIVGQQAAELDQLHKESRPSNCKGTSSGANVRNGRLPTQPTQSPQPSAISPSQPAPPATYQYRNELSPQQVLDTTNRLHDLFKRQPSITFVITSPKESAQFRTDFYAMIVAACHIQPEADCLIEPVPDPDVELDTGIPAPDHAGIVVHAPDSMPYLWGTALTQVLNPCFVVHKTSNIPDGINKLNSMHRSPFVWFELGKGSPWNQRCSGS